MTSLREIGFIPHRLLPAFNKSSSNTALIRSLIAGAFNPQLARIDFPDKKFAQSVSGAVHPSSTLFDAQTFPGNAAYMSYFNKMATSKVFIRDLTRKSLFV
jgi:ATP-dependent RNA helicase DHX57